MIGLFLGDTDFSDLVLKKIKKLKIKYFIIDFSKNNKFKKDSNSYRISIGKFGKIINLIKEKKSKKVLFAGKIAKPKFSSTIINILDKENIKVIKSNYFNPELSQKRGIYTKLKPNRNNLKSIKMGIKHFNRFNKLDHVQALIVKDNKIIASESNKGTKNMISRLKKGSNGILIKIPKTKQDLRMDLPTIGFGTLKDCKKYGLKGIVLQSKKNIFLDKNKCINFANKNKIFIKVI